MTPLPRILAMCAALMVLFLVVACDEEGDKATPSPGIITQTPNVVPTVGAPQDQPPPAQALSSNSIEPENGVVEMTASGTLFADNLIQMEPGDAVIIRVTNSDSVTHNLRIAGVDGEFETEDDAFTAPEAVEAGQTGELTFAPPVEGAYTFRCDFHRDQMGGVVLVGDATAPTSAGEPTSS